MWEMEEETGASHLPWRTVGSRSSHLAHVIPVLPANIGLKDVARRHPIMNGRGFFFEQF